MAFARPSYVVSRRNFSQVSDVPARTEYELPVQPTHDIEPVMPKGTSVIILLDTRAHH